MRCMHCPTSDIGVGSGRLAVARTTSHEHQGLPSSPVRRWCPARDAIGHLTADTLSAYPPGIPNLKAGEVVTPEAIEFLQATIRVPFGMY